MRRAGARGRSPARPSSPRARAVSSPAARGALRLEAPAGGRNGATRERRRGALAPRPRSPVRAARQGRGRLALERGDARLGAQEAPIDAAEPLPDVGAKPSEAASDPADHLHDLAQHGPHARAEGVDVPGGLPGAGAELPPERLERIRVLTRQRAHGRYSRRAVRRCQAYLREYGVTGPDAGRGWLRNQRDLAIALARPDLLLLLERHQRLHPPVHERRAVCWYRPQGTPPRSCS
jgi:hypothetical protein